MFVTHLYIVYYHTFKIRIRITDQDKNRIYYIHIHTHVYYIIYRSFIIFKMYICLFLDVQNNFTWTKKSIKLFFEAYILCKHQIIFLKYYE